MPSSKEQKIYNTDQDTDEIKLRSLTFSTYSSNGKENYIGGLKSLH